VGQILTEKAVQNGKTADKVFSYDEGGQLTKYVENLDGAITTTTYSYNTLGNRVASVRGKKSYAITYEYTEDGQLVKEHNGDTGETIEYEYDENGNLVLKNADGIEYTYTYDVENRLNAVREGGALLMAASYDGDGNRTFQLSRKLVEFTIEKGKTGSQSSEYHADEKGIQGEANGNISVNEAKQPDDRDTLDKTGDNRQTEDTTTQNDATPVVNSYYEKVYEDPADTIFWYGFGQGIVQFFSNVNQALSVDLSNWLCEVWDSITGKYELVIHSDVSHEYSKEDIEALQRAGLTEEDINDILNPTSTPISQNSVQEPNGKTEGNKYIGALNEKDKPENGQGNLIAASPESGEDLLSYQYSQTKLAVLTMNLHTM